MFGLDLDFDGDVDAVDFTIGAIILDDICESERRDARKQALRNAGIDEFDLSMMDSDERRSALEDAGLDPDDYE